MLPFERYRSSASQPGGQTFPSTGPPSRNGIIANTLPAGPTHSSAQHPLDQRPKLPPLLQALSHPGRYESVGSISPSSVTETNRCMLPPASPRTLSHRYLNSERISPHFRQEPIHEPYPPSIIKPETAVNNASELPSQGTFSTAPKRPYSIMTQSPDRYLQQPQPLMSPAYTDAGHSPFHPNYSQPPYSARTSISGPLTPGRTLSVISNTGSSHAPPISHYIGMSGNTTNTSRYSIFVRQQPRAARAGPDGKDRRAIDPPPVLQLMLNDFDPSSELDMGELRSTYYVVHCRLVSAHTPDKDVSTLSSLNDDGSTEVQRLLLGTTVSSPFFCEDDPDPKSMPEHPKTIPKPTLSEAPPSPTSRFIKPRYSSAAAHHTQARTVPLPASFFIFSDLSVRKAGSYRLLFSLMRITPDQLLFGSKLPIIHSVISNIFKVVNAKDFDQVQPSTDLVKGLIERGAGFPLKLKKGTREGQVSRRGRDSREESDDDDDGDGEVNEDNGEAA